MHERTRATKEKARMIGKGSMAIEVSPEAQNTRIMSAKGGYTDLVSIERGLVLK